MRDERFKAWITNLNDIRPIQTVDTIDAEDSALLRKRRFLRYPQEALRFKRPFEHGDKL